MRKTLWREWVWQTIRTSVVNMLELVAHTWGMGSSWWQQQQQLTARHVKWPEKCQPCSYPALICNLGDLVTSAQVWTQYPGCTAAVWAAYGHGVLSVRLFVLCHSPICAATLLPTKWKYFYTSKKVFVMQLIYFWQLLIWAWSCGGASIRSGPAWPELPPSLSQTHRHNTHCFQINTSECLFGNSVCVCRGGVRSDHKWSPDTRSVQSEASLIRADTAFVMLTISNALILAHTHFSWWVCD